MHGLLVEALDRRAVGFPSQDLDAGEAFWRQEINRPEKEKCRMGAFCQPHSPVPESRPSESRLKSIKC